MKNKRIVLGSSPVAQGELYLRRVSVPKSQLRKMKKLPVVRGNLIVGHSETGHHHVIPAKDATVYQDPRDPLKMLVEVKNDTELRHLRNFDTHQPIGLKAGDVAEVRVGREFRNEQMQRSLD